MTESQHIIWLLNDARDEADKALFAINRITELFKVAQELGVDLKDPQNEALAHIVGNSSSLEKSLDIYLEELKSARAAAKAREETEAAIRWKEMVEHAKKTQVQFKVAA